MFRKMAVTMKQDGTQGMIPVAAEVDHIRAAGVAQKRGETLLRIMDNRYSPNKANAIKNAWLNGADLQELAAIHNQ